MRPSARSEAEVHLEQARELADGGTWLISAERSARLALSLLTPNGLAPTSDADLFLYSEAALLIGRAQRSRSNYQVAREWLSVAERTLDALRRVSTDPLLLEKRSELANHQTLLKIHELGQLPRATRRVPDALRIQTEILTRVGPRARMDHTLEAMQRWADVIRGTGSHRQALEFLERGSFLARSEDMWDHNRSHRLMYQGLIELRSGLPTIASKRLIAAHDLDITFQEPALEILWREKMVELPSDLLDAPRSEHLARLDELKSFHG